MKKTNIALLAGLISMVLLPSCGGNKEKEDDISAVEFRSYSYDVIASENISDSLPQEGASYKRISGSGVLPEKIGNYNITSLRDSLCSLAKIIVINDHLAQPVIDDDCSLTKLDASSTEACSVAVNELSIDLVTPQLIVWKDYDYTYPCGAAHGYYDTTYLNYSIKLGSLLSLEQLFGKDYPEKLLPLLREKIKKLDIALLVEPEEIDVPDDFRLTTHTIEFIYPLYSIAPYSEGEVSVEFERYEIEELLEPGINKILYGSNFD